MYSDGCKGLSNVTETAQVTLSIAGHAECHPIENLGAG
jgi:hypothetical protein